MDNKHNQYNKENKAIQEERFGEDEYFETWNMIEEMEDIQKFDTDGAWSKMMNRFEDEDLLPKQEVPVKKMNTNRFYWMAASIALIIGFSVVFNATQNNTIHHFANNTGEVYEYALEDGSKVFLNKGAEISISKGFNSNNRQVALVGEAFFDVARNENIPFEVLVKNASVKVLGTSFNIRSFENSDKVEVLVKTGKVSLSRQADPDQKIALTPNQKGIIDGERLERTKDQTMNYMAWKDKALQFKNTTLLHVIEDISNAYQVDIVLDESLSDSLAITATYHKLSIDELLESICLTMDLSFVKQGESFKLEQR